MTPAMSDKQRAELLELAGRLECPVEANSPRYEKRMLNGKERALIVAALRETAKEPVEPTAAQIDAALKAWFSVRPSAAESDAVLERSMKAALIAAGQAAKEPQR